MNTQSSAGARRCLAAIPPAVVACFLVVSAFLPGCGGKEQGPDAAIVTEMQVLKDENQRLGLRIEALQKALGTRDEAMVEVLKLREELAALSQPDEDVERLKARLAQIENNFERTKTEVADTVQAVRALAGRPAADPRAADAQAELEKLSAKVDKSEDQNEALSAENERLKRRLQSMENGIDEGSKKIKALEDGLDSSQKKIKGLDADLKGAQAPSNAPVAEASPVIASSNDIEVTLSDTAFTNGQKVNVLVSACVHNKGEGTARSVMLRVWATELRGTAAGGGLVCLDHSPKGMTGDATIGDLRPGEMRSVFVTLTYVDVRSGNTAGTSWNAVLDYDVTVR